MAVISLVGGWTAEQAMAPHPAEQLGPPHVCH